MTARATRGPAAKLGQLWARAAGALPPLLEQHRVVARCRHSLQVDRRHERDRCEERAGAGVDAAGVAVRRAPQAVPTTRAPRTRKAKTPEVDPAKNQLLVDAFADAIKQAAAQGGGGASAAGSSASDPR